jgi:hypothetical protein
MSEPVIKLRALYWRRNPQEIVYDYVGREEPHYLVNVDVIRGDTVGTWTVNAWGAFVTQTYTIKQFHALFERRENPTTTDKTGDHDHEPTA